MTRSLHARISVATLAAATAAVSALAWAGRLPLGIAGQWQWGRIEHGTLFVDYAMVAMFVAAYLGLVFGIARWPDASRGWRLAALLALVIGGFVVQTALQGVGFGLQKWPFVLVSRSSSGYYTAARQEVRSAGDFLARYDEIQTGFFARFGPYHLATHPPGLVLLQYGAIGLCERHPDLARGLLALEPDSVRDGFDAVSSPRALPPADEASIWLVALLSQLASALGVIPIYYLARRGLGSSAAWFAAALWPLTPAVTIFMPKSDVLYPVFAAGAAAAALAGTGRAMRWAAGLTAGVILWIGMFLSLALASIAWLVVLAVLWSRTDEGVRGVFERLVAVAAGFVAATVLWGLATQHNQLATLVRCYEIHKAFYAPGRPGADRAYWPWVGFNVLEFAVATGIPVIGAAVLGTAWSWRRWEGIAAAPSANRAALRGREPLGLLLAWWATLIVLNLSGKNLGEIARLWMLLMPFAAVAAAAALERWGGRWPGAALLVLQAVQTVALAASVQGFFDPASLGQTAAPGP